MNLSKLGSNQRVLILSKLDSTDPHIDKIQLTLPYIDKINQHFEAKCCLTTTLCFKALVNLVNDNTQCTPTYDFSTMYSGELKRNLTLQC